jgi:hypothetical protein
MSRWLRLIGLVGALLAAQLVFAMHGIEHVSDVDQGDGKVCVKCLAMAKASAAPPMAHVAMVLTALPPPLPGLAVPPRLTLEHRTHFRSRAPPVLPS